MHDEYKAIVDAGFILQIDDPRMATHYDRTPGASIEECRKFIAARVEARQLCAARHSRRPGSFPHLL